MKNSTVTITVTKELKVGVVCPLWVLCLKRKKLLYAIDR